MYSYSDLKCYNFYKDNFFLQAFFIAIMILIKFRKIPIFNRSEITTAISAPMLKDYAHFFKMGALKVVNNYAR